MEKLQEPVSTLLRNTDFENALADHAGGILVLDYPLSIRDLEELFLERGFKGDHSTINR